MKKLLFIILAFAFGLSISAQNPQLKSGIKFTKATDKKNCVQENHQRAKNQKFNIKIPGDFKNTDVVDIVSIGTCGNGYSMGYAGGQRELLTYNQELNTLAFIHGGGGALNPGGNPADVVYDISTDGGETWTTMIELIQGEDLMIGNPQGAIFNPPGNTNPDEAFVAFSAKLPGIAPGDQEGCVFGRGKIGDITDTTRNFMYSKPSQGIYLSTPQDFTLDNNGQMWMVNYNQNWNNGSLEWLQEIVVTQCVWNSSENDFEFGDQFLLECPSEFRPSDLKIEFSPDGTSGYIAALADIGEVPVSDGMSYYPIVWRSEDSGESWEGPIAVPLAGENGIAGLQYFLSNDELSEIYNPIPPHHEIPFTTAFDFDLTVDAYGNPHIAVVVGITGEDSYSIITDTSPSSGYMYTAAMLISSFDLGAPGSWEAGVMGRLVSFRGTFGEFFTEDNRIQIARNPAGDKVFVSWLDTDTTVSNENNAPDIWCRGVDLIYQEKTENENGENLPTNVTFGSEATFSAYFFSSANEVYYDDVYESFTIPLVYQAMNVQDPSEPVAYKYIQDFSFYNNDFQIYAYITVGIEESLASTHFGLLVSEPSPNPAKESVSMKIAGHQDGKAKIILTNLTGQEVRTLSKRLNTGNNSIIVDVSDLNSGIYFLTIEVGGEAVCKKLIVDKP